MAAAETRSPCTTKRPEKESRFRFFKILGPGVVTGASDDDPSGIGTYSQAGAQLGFSISWTMVLTMAAGIGIGINFTPINPISALYWSAVVNAVAAVPIIVLLVMMASRRAVMGEFAVKSGLKWLGWAATIAMIGAVIGMAATAAVPS